jgi:hypothetical protein
MGQSAEQSMLDQPHDFLTLFGIPVADDQDRPGLRHRQGRGPADSRPAPGYDPDFALQVCHYEPP